MSEYTPTIGLEIHAELKTTTKMFCSSRNAPHDSEPNTHICPICMGHPGTLPVINKEAVRYMLMIGHALGGSIASFSEFDRKNYFYPDIPKGYQISQYKYPLVSGGSLAGVVITRVHLEEDTARSQHDVGDESLVDYNRAGVPLMELVTEPVIHDAETAGAFARELQLLLRTLDVSDANMERGEMRVEANISISTNDTLGTKVEVKNLNSFKSVESAIKYEIKRQKMALQSGEKLVQETRGWNENTGKTFTQRKKESSHDYRYFPDPDLPKLDISEIEEFSESRINDIMPELPDTKRQKYNDLGIPRNQIETLIAHIPTARFFDALIEACRSENEELIVSAANYTTSDVLGHIAHTPELNIGDASVEHFVALLKLLHEGSIGSRVAKDLLPEVVFEKKDPHVLAKERDLLQASGEDEITPIVEQVLEEHKDVVEDYKNGKESAIKFLVGQGMRMSKGSANPSVLKQMLEDRMNG